MIAVLGNTKDLFKSAVDLLNQPIVKDSVKKIAGATAFVFGLVEIYDVYQIARGREISTEDYSDYPVWLQTANKVSIVCAKLSLILSGAVSPPGVFIISSLSGCLISTGQLERAFGPNTIFAINPWHPRHLVSIAAVLLALPSVAQSACKGVHWIYRKIQRYHPTQEIKHEVKTWLTDNKIRIMALINTMASRPALHILNPARIVHLAV